MDTTGVYFYHIPKTAGMSVWHFLDQGFPCNDICPWWLWDQLITVARGELSNWKIFRGHFLSHLAPYLCRSLKTFTILRDPLERTISHFCHVRRAPDHPFHLQARRMSLEEFCVHEETRHMVENYQAAYLAKAPEDPIGMADRISKDGLSRHELQERLQYPDDIPDPATLVRRAEQRLATFVAVGITEQLNESLHRVASALGCSAPEPFPPQNVNPEPMSVSNLDQKTLTLIRKLTEVDQYLYDSVKRSF
jgi:hypothetical protein